MRKARRMGAFAGTAWVLALSLIFEGVAPRAVYARSVKVGVGYILNTLDGTSESFSLASYLRENPTAVPGEVVLIDHPLDADYSISGQIDGSVGADYADVQGTISSWRDFFTLLAFFPLVMETAGILAEPVKDGVLGRRDVYDYNWAQTGNFVLRRRGRQIDTFQIHSSGKQKESAPASNLRNFVNADMWKQLAAHLDVRIKSDQAAPNAEQAPQTMEGGAQ